MIIPSIRQRRIRFNHERMLSFAGLAQMTFAGAVYTHFSCIINARNQLGNFIGTGTVAALGIPTNQQRFVFGAATGTVLSSNGNEDFEISNLVLYDREPTNAEKQSIRNSGGLLPSSLHPNVKHHWPLTQLYYFNDAGTLKAWDSVGQYFNGNVPIHGTLVNFTNAQVGADEPANQSAIFGIYNKQIESSWGLKFNGTSQFADGNPLTNVITLGVSNWAFFLDITSGDTLSRVLLDTVASTTAMRLKITQGGANLSLIFSEGTTGGSADVSIATTVGANERFRLLFLYTDFNDQANWQAYINGSPVGILVNSNTLVGGLNFAINALRVGFLTGGGGTYFDGVFNDFHLYNDVLTIKEITDLFSNAVTPSAKLVDRINPGKRSDNQVNTPLGNQLLLQNFTLSQFDDYYRERESVLPETKDLLTWTTSNQVQIPLTAIDQIGLDEFSIVCVFEIDDFAVQQDLYRIEYGASVTRVYQWVQNSTQDVVAQVLDSPDFNRRSVTDGGLQKPFIVSTMNVKSDRFLDHFLNNVFSGPASENGITDLNVTGTTTALIVGKNLNWIRFTIYRGNLSKKEHLNLYNNALLRSLQKDTYLDYFFNASSFYEDGTNVKIRDYSGGGHDGTVTGFTGATSADQLSTLRNSIISIDSVR